MSFTHVSDDALIGEDSEKVFLRLVEMLREVQTEIESVLTNVEVYIDSMQKMCVASSNAVKSITKFYGETDGRLGSSAIVHLHAIEEPFQTKTVPYVSKLQLACYSGREQYKKIFDTFDSRIKIRNAAHKEYLHKQKQWKKKRAKHSFDKRQKSTADLTGSLIRFEMFHRALCEDIRLFIEQRHDPFDTLLMATMNVRFSVDGCSYFDVAQKRTLNDEYQMKLLALKLPLTVSPAHIIASLDNALANHFAYQYFKKYLTRLNRVEDINFWESARLRTEIRRSTVRAEEAEYIYERYFGAHADPGVDISQRALAKLLRRKASEPGARSLFDEAHAEVYARLADLYAAFRRSEEYQRLLDRLTFTSFGVNDNLNERLSLASADDTEDLLNHPLLVSLANVPRLHFGAALDDDNTASASSSTSHSHSYTLPSRDPNDETVRTPSFVDMARWKREQESQMQQLERALAHERLSPRVSSGSIRSTRAYWADATDHRDELAKDLPRLSRDSLIDYAALPPLPKRPDAPHSPRAAKQAHRMARPSLSPRPSNDYEHTQQLLSHAVDTIREESAAVSPRSRAHHRATSPRHSSRSVGLNARSPRSAASPRRTSIISPRHRRHRHVASPRQPTNTPATTPSQSLPPHSNSSRRQRATAHATTRRHATTAWSSSSPSPTPSADTTPRTPKSAGWSPRRSGHIRKPSAADLPRVTSASSILYGTNAAGAANSDDETERDDNARPKYKPQTKKEIVVNSNSNGANTNSDDDDDEGGPPTVFISNETARRFLTPTKK